MKTLVVDRLEGIYAICEDENKTLFAVELAEFSGGVRPGDVIRQADTGEFSIDAEETERRHNRILEKRRRLLERSGS